MNYLEHATTIVFVERELDLRMTATVEFFPHYFRCSSQRDPSGRNDEFDMFEKR